MLRQIEILHEHTLVLHYDNM